jgi:hypothetical protein
MSRYFKPSRKVLHERFGDEAVIVHLDSGCYYSVQHSGDMIWQGAVDGASECEIVTSVIDTYEGDSTALQAETTAFLDRLVAERLMDVAEKPALVQTPAAARVNKRIPFIAPTLQKYTDMEELLLLDPIHEVDELGWPSARKVPA